MASQPSVLRLNEQEEEQYYVGLSLLQLALRRLRRDRLTIIAMIIVGTVTVLSILAPVIERYVLQNDLANWQNQPDFRLYANSMLNDPFIPPGGAKRIVYQPDYPFRAATLTVVVLLDRRGEYQQVLYDMPRRLYADNPGMGGLCFVHGVSGQSAVRVFLNDQTDPFARSARFAQKAESMDNPACPYFGLLEPGNYSITIRDPEAEEGAAPMFVAETVQVLEGQTTTAVWMGSPESEARPIELRTFTVNETDIPDGQNRVQAIVAATNLNVQINFLVQNSQQFANMSYGESAIGERRTGRAHVAFSDVNAYRHPLGSDDLGRDQLARLLYAGQVSLGIAFFAAMLQITIGVTVGIITGFYGGLIDDIFTWVITTISSIPFLPLLLIIVSVLNPGPATLVLVLGLLGWLGIARLVRGETLSIRAREYIVSARSIGAPVSRILFVHILPNLLSVIIIALMLDIGGLILTESGLSFLGFGIKPPTPSWGNMLTGAQDFFKLGAHLVIPPGIMISITVLCLYVIGDGLRDAFDPTLRN